MSAPAFVRLRMFWSASALRGSAAWQMLQTLSGTGAEVAILLVLAAVQSPEEFGAFAVSLGGAKIVFLLFEVRIHEFLTPKLARYLKRSRRGVWGWTIWSRRIELQLNALALGLCLIISGILSMISSVGHPSLFAVGALYCFANTLLKFSSLAILRCIGRVPVAAVLAIGAGGAKLLLLWVCVVSDASIKSTLLVLLVPAFLAALSQAVMAVKLLRALVGPPTSYRVQKLRAHNRRHQAKLMLSNYATGLIEIAHRELDVQLVAWVGGAVEAGRYRVAKTLAMSMLEALNPVVLVLLPELVRRLALPARREIGAFLRRISLLLGGIGVASAVIVTSVTFVYLQWFASAQRGAWTPTLIFIACFAVLSPTMWAQAYLVAAGRPHVYMKVSLAGALLAMVAASLLIGHLGATGAAIAHCFGLAFASSGAALAALRHGRSMSGFASRGV